MPAGLLPAASLPSHTPAATSEPRLFIETLSSKKKSLSNSSEERDVFSYSVTLKL